jgi:AcrR family transcriptional regulator
MQIKKKEMKNKLLQSAKNEFLKHGYEGTSIRTIVKCAETTIGNFYNYFGGKEDVFNAIVMPTHTIVSRFIKNRRAQDEDSDLFKKLDAASARKIVFEALNLFSDSFIEDLILLADCSKGTKYENFSDNMANYMCRHFDEHKSIINPDYNNKGISMLLSQQFLDGVLSVMKEDTSTTYKVDLIAEYLIFYTYGMLGILKK